VPRREATRLEADRERIWGANQLRSTVIEGGPAESRLTARSAVQVMRRAGLLRAAVYLVRPDGYVGLADPHARPERLRYYY
jgi:hypothetical protein